MANIFKSDSISMISTPNRTLVRQRSLPPVPSSPSSSSLYSDVQGSDTPFIPFSPPPPDRPLSQVGFSTCTQTYSPEVCTSSCNTEITGLSYSFSPKLCMELLPTLNKQQLNFEYNYFYQNFRGFSTEHRTRGLNDIAKKSAVYRHFESGLKIDLERYVYNLNYYSKLTDDFSNTLEELKTWLAGLETVKRDSSVESQLDDLQVDYQPSSEPVYFLPFDLDCITDYICDRLSFRKIGSRQCAYFGSGPYEYKSKGGLIRHDAAPYPTSGKLREIVDYLCDNIDNRDFNLTNYTCLVTLYDDNSACLPYHSDNEPSIHPDSIIYTVSVGASRTVQFRSISKDESQYRSCVPQSGSVYCMSRASQDMWQHSVPASNKPVNCPPRVSLTFRYLTDPPVQSQASPPPSSPAQPRTPNPTGPSPSKLDFCSSQTSVPPSPKRVLFLTDSIHAQFNAKNFNFDTVCDKRLCFKLRDITQYEKCFAKYDIVIFHVQ